MTGHNIPFKARFQEFDAELADRRKCEVAFRQANTKSTKLLSCML